MWWIMCARAGFESVISHTKAMKGKLKIKQRLPAKWTAKQVFDDKRFFFIKMDHLQNFQLNKGKKTKKIH